MSNVNGGIRDSKHNHDFVAKPKIGVRANAPQLNLKLGFKSKTSFAILFIISMQELDYINENRPNHKIRSVFVLIIILIVQK